MVLPLFVFSVAFLAEKSFRFRGQWMAASAVALLFYFGLRWLAMGPGLADYSNYGYLAGVYYYDYPGELPGLWRYLAYLDVLLKNLAAPVLQGFVEDGGSLLDRARILGWLPMWLSSAALFVIAASRRLAPYQKWALILILLNAGVHIVLFRYRNHDTSQIAALIFIAAAPAFAGIEARVAAVSHSRAGGGAAALEHLLDLAAVQQHCQQEYLGAGLLWIHG